MAHTIISPYEVETVNVWDSFDGREVSTKAEKRLH